MPEPTDRAQQRTQLLQALEFLERNIAAYTAAKVPEDVMNIALRHRKGILWELDKLREQGGEVRPKDSV